MGSDMAFVQHFPKYSLFYYTLLDKSIPMFEKLFHIFLLEFHYKQ